MKARNARSDSATAAVQAAQNAAQGPLDPPAHVYVPEGVRPFWDAVVRNRPRHRWNDADLTTAAILARAQFDVERLQREIGTEGDLTASGTLNPKHRLLETLTKRVATLMRLLHVHAEATIGRAEDNAKTLETEREGEGTHSRLIPTLRAVS